MKITPTQPPVSTHALPAVLSPASVPPALRQPLFSPAPADHTATRGPSLIAGLASPKPEIGISVVGTPRDFETRAAAFLLRGEIRANGVGEMVDQVLAAAEGKVIGRLAIYDHGSPGCQGIGAEGITLVNGELPLYLENELSRLTPCFASGAEVTLHGCNAGEGEAGEALLIELSELWGVTVRAGQRAQNPLLPGIEGPVVTAFVWDEERHRSAVMVD